MSTNSVPASSTSTPTVVGINFGNSYASIAVITKEGNAECIANEDGERQIAAAISFHGEELYIGNQATPQLIKNSQNTITGFRNLLGIKFSELPSKTDAHYLTPSAPLIPHPSLPDTPCYAVQVIVPAPQPLARTPVSRGTPVSSRLPTPSPTPASEPLEQTRHLTPHDATVLFIRSLLQSASEFLGRTPDGAVLTVPAWFTAVQRAALYDAAHEAGVKVLQLLEEDTAAAVLMGGECKDRTTLLVDWGATECAISLLSVHAGLVSILASTRDNRDGTTDNNDRALGSACADSADEILVRHFAREFTKKTGEALEVCPAPTPAFQRAQAKLVIALPHVKRSLTSGIGPTSQNATQAQSKSSSTQLSIESLHAGLDFSAPLNRTRAAGLLAPVVHRICDTARDVLCRAKDEDRETGVDPLYVDTLLLIGGNARLASDALLALLGEHAEEEALGASDELLARACAMHARDIVHLVDEVALTDHALCDTKVTQRTLGVLIPSPPTVQNGSANPDVEWDLGGEWINIVRKGTPLPARRTVRFEMSVGVEGGVGVFEVWEVREVVRVRRVKVEVPPLSDEEEGNEDQAEEEVEEEERERAVQKERFLGTAVLPLTVPKKKNGRVSVSIRFDVSEGGEVKVGAREGEGAWVEAAIA